jgi:hypothetical protein
MGLLWAPAAQAQMISELSAHGSPVGLESDLTAAFVSFFREDSSDTIATQTAQALKTGEIPIRLVPVPGTLIGAVYDQSERAVLINLNYLASRYASSPLSKENRAEVMSGIRSSWERSPQSLRTFVLEMGPLMVHEVRHALFAEALGPHPSSIEEEMACHAYEALFVRRRLKRNPDYLGFREYDSLVRQVLKEPPAVGRWWQDPFPFSPIAKIAAAVETVNKDFPGRFKLNPLLWLHVRSLSEGFAHYRLVFVSTYPQEKFSLEADPQEILAELRAEDLDAKGRKVFPESEIHRIAVGFWSDPKRVRQASGTFEGEWTRLDGLIRQENAEGEKPRAGDDGDRKVLKAPESD